MSDEWRNLGPEDNFQEGDEWAEKGKDRWTLVASNCFGDRIGYLWDRVYDFRRRVYPEKEAVANLEANPYYLALRHAEEKLQQAEEERDEARRKLSVVTGKLAYYHAISGTQHDGADVDLEVCSLCGYADGHDDDCFVQRLEGLYEAEDELRQAEKERDQLRAENERLREALDSACKAGLALGENCRLNPTAYVNDIKRAQASLAAKGETLIQPQDPEENANNVLIESCERTERCGVCGNQTSDWVDVDWRGRICRTCESKGETK